MKNYLRYAFGLVLLVVQLIYGLGYLPTPWVEEAGLKPVDILADLNQGNSIEALDDLDAETGADSPARSEGYSISSVTGSDTLPSADSDSSRPVSTILVESFLPPPADTLPSADSSESRTSVPDTLPPAPHNGTHIPILDYSPGGTMFRTFSQKLNNVPALHRPLRIGFMGDSFIEGDLLTGDFRELMQNQYGGGGVGFVPITSQVAGFRQTVRHKFNQWKQSSIVQNRSGSFTISAFHFTPSENSYVEYKGSSHHKHLDHFGRARLLFVSEGRSVIRATVNGQEEFLFNTEPKDVLQEVQLDGNFQSIRYQISDVEGFRAYGVYLENPTGVSVDNFSVRGNPGTVMDRINPELSRQFGKLSPYDLIVLQYGLNVVQSQVTNYSAYHKQMTAVVNHIKRCFPGVAILIMSVGDRATRNNGVFVTMPGIRAMVKTQEQVARDCGVLFWSTYDAMRSQGGMSTFVKNGWAAKDYTHISARGGRKIATALFEAVTTPVP